MIARTLNQTEIATINYGSCAPPNIFRANKCKSESNAARKEMLSYPVICWTIHHGCLIDGTQDTTRYTFDTTYQMIQSLACNISKTLFPKNTN